MQKARIIEFEQDLFLNTKIVDKDKTASASLVKSQQKQGNVFGTALNLKKKQRRGTLAGEDIDVGDKESKSSKSAGGKSGRAKSSKSGRAATGSPGKREELEKKDKGLARDEPGDPKKPGAFCVIPSRTELHRMIFQVVAFEHGPHFEHKSSQ